MQVQLCKVHKHRNRLAHGPEPLHQEIKVDYGYMSYAGTCSDVQRRRWAWRCAHPIMEAQIIGPPLSVPRRGIVGVAEDVVEVLSPLHPLDAVVTTAIAVHDSGLQSMALSRVLDDGVHTEGSLGDDD